MSVLAIIPARGGSKGIKRKNLVDLNGIPLIVHSIQHALASEEIKRVIVSTDDPEIARVSQQAGAEVPFMRPNELAQDHVLDLPVFEHCLDFLLQTENYSPELVVHLRPTAPYREPIWIDEAVHLLRTRTEAHSVRSVSEPEKHPYRMFSIDPEGFLDPIMKHLHPVPYLLRRQDLPKVYFYNCVIDVTRPSTIREHASMTGSKIWPYLMQAERVIDIDTHQDLLYARWFFSQMG
ncbi:MAG: acylneuraminate cytidylyltransferase family protein [Cytophagales bacterium]|nr:MAG: acylneuraminate cytidylyltransferase family protein [Cytophagales bacterium]TAF60185.1 MAG: acylneuraminate cytidylyltransferase family protein [Cytophagales bacterium]